MNSTRRNTPFPAMETYIQRMVSALLLVSYASKARGFHDYVVKKWGPDHPNAKVNGRPTPQDVYDAVAGSAITPLSEASIRKGGETVDFPDFTNGKWMHRKNTFALDDPF